MVVWAVCVKATAVKDKSMRDLKIPQQRHPEKAKRPDNPQPKKPSWIRVKAPVGNGYQKTRDIMREHKLVTLPATATVLPS